MAVNNGDLVSIIIPVYNCEKYIKNCLESIKNQTYKNIEVLIINDGSADKTKEICENYVKKDKRFKLINQSNNGVSYSRNVGLRKARGKFVQFTDADDWLEKDMIEQMVRAMIKDDSDIVICEYYNYYQQSQKKEHIRLNDYNNLTFKDLISDETTLYGGFPWNKLIKANLITTYYDESIHYYENLLFFLENSLNIKRYSCVHKPLYTYNINQESAVHCSNYNPKKISILYAFIKIVDIVDDKYKDLYKYLFISKYHENYLNYKKNNLEMNSFEDLSKYEKLYYNDIRKKNNLSKKNKIKLFIIKKLPFIYKFIKNR